ncbi:DUF2218 domain-containing protein [Streptacidiphilus sp. MAP12-16]|uniref:DUF2218 domain-containing protein n=1 Tax=Streptacidiphilus sp. MAP12-16 TaxID=3156300 RepID=UPI003512D232
MTAHLTALTARLASMAGLRGRAKAATVDQATVVRSEARVPTARSARYAKQLCSHAAWKTPRAQWTEPNGVIEFPDRAGSCRITAESDCLVLAVEAAGPAELARLQQIISGNIERFAAREGLTVQWVPR